MINKLLLVSLLAATSAGIQAMKAKVQDTIAAAALMELKYAGESSAAAAGSAGTKAGICFSDVVVKYKSVYAAAGILEERVVVRLALARLGEFIQDGTWAYGKHPNVQLQGAQMFTALLESLGLKKDAIDRIYDVGQTYRHNRYNSAEPTMRQAWHQAAVPLMKIYTELYAEFAAKHLLQEMDGLKTPEELCKLMS